MLTQKQLQSIRKNITNRGVDTIDLEIEMMDHISSSVEDKMKEGMSFRNAYKATMLEFGPFGMEELQREKQRLLINQGIKLIAKKVVELITPPKILISLAVSVLLFFLFKEVNNRSLVFQIIFYALPFVSLVGYAVISFSHIKMRYTHINAFQQIFFGGYYALYVLPLIVGAGFTADGIVSKTDFSLTLLIMLPALLVSAYFMVLNAVFKELRSKYSAYELT